MLKHIEEKCKNVMSNQQICFMDTQWAHLRRSITGMFFSHSTFAKVCSFVRLSVSKTPSLSESIIYPSSFILQPLSWLLGLYVLFFTQNMNQMAQEYQNMSLRMNKFLIFKIVHIFQAFNFLLLKLFLRPGLGTVNT